MKKYLIIAAIALAVAAVVTIWVQRSRINQLTGERDKYRTNTETLLQDVSRYQTKDSLNAAKVGVLELKLSEFEKYRASDAELIKTLQTKNRELERVTTTQMETINELRQPSGIVWYICSAIRLRPFYDASILSNRILSCTDAPRRTDNLPGRI